jgi:hypothetical protein
MAHAHVHVAHDIAKVSHGNARENRFPCLRLCCSPGLVLASDEQPLLGVQHARASRLALDLDARADSPRGACSQWRDRSAAKWGVDAGPRGGAGRADAHAPVPGAACDSSPALFSASASGHGGKTGHNVAPMRVCGSGRAPDRDGLGRPCSAARARGPLSASDSRPIVRPRHAGNITDSGRRICAAGSISDKGGFIMSNPYRPVGALAHARSS